MVAFLSMCHPGMLLLKNTRTWADAVSNGAFRRTKGAPRRAGDAKDKFSIISSPD